MRNSFSKNLLAWYQKHGRFGLPWQKQQTPYRVWVSEVMLQQTQVNTVVPYYLRFMKRFPTVKSLADAKENSVLSYWSGLGYYARARNLHRSAKIIHEKFNGRFPKTVDELAKLPGIGRSTAGAILSFGYKIPAPILDGNVKRVLARYYAIEGWPDESKTLKQLWDIAISHTPKKNVHEYNQAIMDLGAMICIRSQPKCQQCPIHKHCQAHQTGRESEFPKKKPTKLKPVKQSIFLIVQNAHSEILLEKRPPTGVWGGLWSFPECSIEKDIQQWCFEKFNSKAAKIEQWKNFTHVFSHFELQIYPYFLRIQSKGFTIMDSQDKIWYKLDQELPGGIAAPIKKLLLQLKKY